MVEKTASNMGKSVCDNGAAPGAGARDLSLQWEGFGSGKQPVPVSAMRERN